MIDVLAAFGHHAVEVAPLNNVLKRDQVPAGEDNVPPEETFMGFSFSHLLEFLHVGADIAPRIPNLWQKVLQLLSPRGNGEVELFRQIFCRSREDRPPAGAETFGRRLGEESGCAIAEEFMQKLASRVFKIAIPILDHPTEFGVIRWAPTLEVPRWIGGADRSRLDRVPRDRIDLRSGCPALHRLPSPTLRAESTLTDSRKPPI